MSNEYAKDELAALIDEFDGQMRGIADLQRQRAQLTATATELGKRVTITVNADGTVIETRFTDIAGLSAGQLARAVTAAAQAAAADVAHQGSLLTDPLRRISGRLPKLSDLIEGMPDLGERIPQPPPVPLTPPKPEQVPPESDAMTFTDVEEVDRAATEHRATDKGW
ncbi:YbaB/EbfC family nucleoid-associated protein [Nocardia australiensis]|uniref:YbaB/EbfC family nucleoid-associated protein n=1 Tax=Nocardia australiensis TaxID=2887191 RepID=UPI001D13E0E7|nr:YbaB/EbfC family nucleoid-associated protein [Nocardia australiensis]